MACLSSRKLLRRILIVLVLSLVSVWYLFPGSKYKSRPIPPAELERKYPLLWRHVHTFNGTGGGTLKLLDSAKSNAIFLGFGSIGPKPAKQVSPITIRGVIWADVSSSSRPYMYLLPPSSLSCSRFI
jgi:hypothetical protein